MKGSLIGGYSERIVHKFSTDFVEISALQIKYKNVLQNVQGTLIPLRLLGSGARNRISAENLQEDGT